MSTITIQDISNTESIIYVDNASYEVARVTAAVGEANTIKEDTQGLYEDTVIAKDAAVDAKKDAVIAKGAAETAEDGAEAAQGLAEDAQLASEAARDLAQGYATNASTYATNASGSADDASTYATNASNDATNASNYATTALGAKKDAEAAATTVSGLVGTPIEVDAYVLDFEELAGTVTADATLQISVGNNIYKINVKKIQ